MLKIYDAMNGSRVVARAGMMGSGNIRVTITSETICPSDSNIPMKRKPVKCLLEKILKKPQKESKVHSQPLIK